MFDYKNKAPTFTNKRQPILLINVETGTYKEFLYMKDAATFLNTSHTQIRNYLNKNKPYKGYIIKLNNNYKYRLYLFSIVKTFTIIILIVFFTLFIYKLIIFNINFYTYILNQYNLNKINSNSQFIDLMLNNRLKIYNNNNKFFLIVPKKLFYFININDGWIYNHKLYNFSYENWKNYNSIPWEFNSVLANTPMIGFKKSIYNLIPTNNLPSLRLNTNVGLGIINEGPTPKELLNYQSNILFVWINGISPSIF